MKNLASQLYTELSSLTDSIPSGFKALYATVTGFWIKRSDSTITRLITTDDTILPNYRTAIYKDKSFKTDSKQIVSMPAGTIIQGSQIVTDYLYTTTRTSPCVITKSLLDDLTQYTQITLPSDGNHNDSECIVYSTIKNKLYLCFSNSLGNITITEIDPITFTYNGANDVVVNLNSSGYKYNSYNGIAVSCDGPNLYVMYYGRNSRILKIKLADYSVQGTCDLTSICGKGFAYSLEYDGKYLYAASSSAPPSYSYVNLPGTVQTAGTTALVGTGTNFLTALSVGDIITVQGETARTIATITDNTHLTVSVAFSTSGSGKTIKLTYGYGTVTTNGTNSIVGIGTTFLTTVAVGDVICINNDLTVFRTVQTIIDNTHLNVDSPFPTSGSYVYQISQYNKSFIVKVDPANMSIILSNVTFNVLSGWTNDMIIVGDYIWLGQQAQNTSAPYMIGNGVIQRVKKTDLTAIDTIVVPNVSSTGCCYAIAYDGQYIWVGFNTTPGYIAKIDPTTFDIYVKTLDSGEDYPNEMLFDKSGRLLLTYLQTPSKIARYYQPSFSEIYLSANTNVIPTTSTYNNLQTLKNNSQLIPYQWYIFPYQTIHCIPYTLETINIGTTEHLLIQASSANTFFRQVKSIEKPKDFIEYDFDLNLCEDFITSRPGYIISRIDDFRNKVTLDHRNIKFRRFKADLSSVPAYDSGTAYIAGQMMIYNNNLYINISTFYFGAGILPTDTYGDCLWCKLFGVNDYVCIDNGLTPLTISLFNPGNPSSPLNIYIYGQGSGLSTLSFFAGMIITKIWQYSNNSIYVGTQGNGVYVSTNNGSTWTHLSSGLSGNSLNVKDFALWNDGNGHLAIIIATGGGLYKCTYPNNGSTSWTSYGLSTYDITGIINISYQNYYACTIGGIYRTSNDGSTWTNIGTSLPGVTILAMYVKASNLYVAINGYGVYYTSNNGAIWTGSINNSILSSIALYGFSGASDSASILLSTSSGLYVSSNNGVSWASSGFNISTLCSANFYNSKYDAQSNVYQGILIGTDNDNGIYLTYNNCESYSLLMNMDIVFGSGQINKINSMLNVNGVIFISTENGLYTYTNNITTSMYHDYLMLQDTSGSLTNAIYDNEFDFVNQTLSEINCIFIANPGTYIKNARFKNASLQNSKFDNCSLLDVNIDGYGGDWSNNLMYNLSIFLMSGTVSFTNCFGDYTINPIVNILERIMFVNILGNNPIFVDLTGNGEISGVYSTNCGVQANTFRNFAQISAILLPYPAGSVIRRNLFMSNFGILDFSAATYLCADYDCEVGVNSISIPFLRYTDNDNVLQYVDPTT